MDPGAGYGVSRERAPQGIRVHGGMVRPHPSDLRGALLGDSRRSGRAARPVRGDRLENRSRQRAVGPRAPVPHRGAVLLTRRPLDHGASADRALARARASADPVRDAGRLRRGGPDAGPDRHPASESLSRESR